MLPRIEISTANYFPVRALIEIINEDKKRAVNFSYSKNTAAFVSWGYYNYVQIKISPHSSEMKFEKTETTHILVMALKLLVQYHKATGELENVR